MIALDTPLLEDLLRGRKRAAAWLRRLEASGEVATTEANLLELAQIARKGGGGKPLLRRRLEAVEAVRRSVTVLPLDAESSRRSQSLLVAVRRPVDPLFVLTLGICEAHGVSELLTRRRAPYPKYRGAVRVVQV